MFESVLEEFLWRELNVQKLTASSPSTDTVSLGSLAGDEVAFPC